MIIVLTRNFRHGLVVTAPASQRARARVPKPLIVTEVNAPQNLSCQSPGQSVHSCLWGHRADDSNQVVIIDEQAVRNGRATSVQGVSFAGHDGDLEGGDCTIQISNATQDHVGLWSCTLITGNSTVFNGAVSLGKTKCLSDLSIAAKIIVWDL